MFADVQGVTSYGYDKYAYFSGSPTKMEPDFKPGAPVYLIAADYGKANGLDAYWRYMRGKGLVYPLVRRDPTPKTTPTPRR